MRPGKALFSGIALIVFLACPPATAEDMVIPAFSYTTTNDIAGNPITIDEYGWLHGLDCTGEWLEYHFDLVEFGVHSSNITVMGTTGVDFHLQMELSGDLSRSTQIIQFNFTGSGFVG
jgi:hypothetical protein